MGVQALGMGIGTLVHEMGVRPDIVTGHDYRAYSLARSRYALVSGLMAAGLRVNDIGLALSPMAYFAQFALDCPCVAMVTASHNDNGWTGVKMGANRPLTFGPGGDGRGCATSCSAAGFELRDGRRLRVRARISPSATSPTSPTRPKLKRKLKVVAPAATAPPAPSRREVLEAHRLRGRAARRRARLHLPALQPEPRGHEDAARHRRQGAARAAPMSASASTATATAAASSTTRARRSSPTRSG